MIQELIYATFIGQGATAKVYRTTYQENEAACKVSEQPELLKREWMILQELEGAFHPIGYDFRQEDGVGYLWMEYVHGISVKELMSHYSLGLKRDEAYEIALGILRNLRELHENRNPMIYMDLKPENIMVEPDGRVRFIDYGAVLYVGEIAEKAGGTYGYSAPEQFWPGYPKTLAIDIYSFGKIFYYLLTGMEPIHVEQGEEPMVTYNIDLTTEEKDYLRVCLSKEDQMRFPNARIAENALIDLWERKKRYVHRGIRYKKSIWKSTWYPYV